MPSLKEQQAFIDLYLNDEYEDVDNVEVLNVFPNTKGIQFSADMFDEFIQNFEKYKNEKTPHVKIDHTSQQAILKAITGKTFEEGTELPNLGFVKRFYHDGKSMFADITKVPRKLKNIIFDGKMFKAISPEATYNFRGLGEKVITALSLTNNPAQKHVLDVHMNENTDESVTVSPGARPLHFSGDIKIDGGISMADQVKETTPQVNTEEMVEKLSEKVLPRLMTGIKDFFKKDEKPATSPEATVALSEYNELKGKFDTMSDKINQLSAALIEKDNAQKNFSEQLASIKNQTRGEKTEAICKVALSDGVPPVVVNHFKPVLNSEKGEQMIKLSETIDGKIVEAEKSLTDLIKDFFKIYPNKIDFNDRTVTRIEEPGESEEVEMSEINKIKREYMTQGMTEHDALQKAGVEYYDKKKRGS